MNAETIGRFIRETRTNMGLSQKKLAELVHVSVKTVSKWETGNGYPNITVLPDLAKVLQTSIEALLEGSSFPEHRDGRLDYENTDNPLQATDFEGIWIIKPFHTMNSAIKHGKPLCLQVINKQTNEVVLTVDNCVACWEGICGWEGKVNHDISIITSSYKHYIIKKDLYRVVNPLNLRSLG